MTRKTCSLGRQRGVSLLEAIAYLGVAATIIVGAVALLTNAFSGARANRAQEEITAISTGVKRLFMSRAGSYGDQPLNETLSNARIFPTTLAVQGAAVTNAWNGAVTVTGDTAVFTISYANVPQDVCIELMSSATQFVSVSANGGEAATPPVAIADAAAQCTGTENTITWTDR